MENEAGVSPDYLPMDPKRLLERFHTALNTRDIANLVHLLQVDFEQFRIGQSQRNTVGIEAARQEWERMFTTFTNFRADLLRQAIEGNVIWSEWRFSGNRGSGQGSDLRQEGVIILGVEEGLIAWTRTYLVDVAAEA